MADEIELTPEPGILIESLRDIGYSFNSALADIIDNSITAHAQNISIFAMPVDDSFKVAIIDDGDGLGRSELLQAMRLGSTNPRDERTSGDLGRFGLGLNRFILSMPAADSRITASRQDDCFYMGFGYRRQG